MKLQSIAPTRHRPPNRSDVARPRKLVARVHYPTVSIVPLRSSPLARLAWIFGFGR
jgi:hypothetical protein